MARHTNEISLDERIGWFQGDIGRYGAADTRSLPILTEAINHNAKFVQIDRDLPQGVYLDETLRHDQVDYGFYVQPGNRLTREDSHNKVFFGSMLILPHGEQAETHAQVAVKTRISSETPKLLGEMALFQHLNKLGLKTFDSAVLIIGEEATHFATHFEGNVATMDTVDWHELSVDEAWVEVGKAVETMYQLHTNALFHGDLEFRNVAFDQTGETVIIDPELMVSAQDYFEEFADAGIMLSPDQQIVLHKLVQKMSSEFASVCKSIDENIIPLIPRDRRPRADEARLKLYKQHLFEPYKSRLRDESGPFQPLLLRLIDDMVARKKQQAKEQIL